MNKTVSRDEWLSARKAHLAKEKALTKQRDALSAERRQLPWLRIKQDYVFEGPGGKVSLADLFGGCSQLIVYHFMFHPDWETGCKSCSFWADNFERIIPHLAARDTNLVAVSRAPLATIAAFKKRMNWSFDWVSSAGTDFNRDFNVSFTPEELENGGGDYNFGSHKFRGPEAPGASVFFKDASGDIFHTYSCYARGLEMMNAAYHYLDLTPKGRDEDALPYPMHWVRLRDEYGREQSPSK
jgi:predicted dithiol-disulfide oxidoreductase (DUF899 family)